MKINLSKLTNVGLLALESMAKRSTRINAAQRRVALRHIHAEMSIRVEVQEEMEGAMDLHLKQQQAEILGDTLA